MIPRLFSLLSSARTLTGMAFSVVLLVGYVYYSNQMPQTATTRPVPQALDAAANNLCQTVPFLLPEPERALKPTLLIPLNGDREGLFTDRLRTSLDQQGWYRTVEASLLEKVFATTKELTGLGSDPSVRSMQWTDAELAKMMRSAKTEAALRGSVDRLALSSDGTVEIKLRLELWELSSSDSDTAVLLRQLNLEPPEPVAAVTPNPNRRIGLWSYGIILLIALIWPFTMISWMRNAIREDSNSAILRALLGITAIPLCVFLVYLLWQGAIRFDIVLQGVIAALFLFFYTAFILKTIEE